MKKIFCLLILLEISLFTFSQIGIVPSSQSGSGIWVYTDTKNDIEIKYDFTLTQFTETKLTVGLNIKNLITNINYNYGTFEFKADNILDSSQLRNLLKNKYYTLLAQLSRSTILTHGVSFDKMISSVGDTISNHGTHTFVYQGFLAFQAIFKGAQRDVNNNGTIDFTIFGGYVIATNTFVCAEDLKFNIADFKSYLINRKQTDSTNVGIDYYLGALMPVTSAVLNFKEISKKLSEYFERENYPIRIPESGKYNPEESRFPQGGQCGCCANYSGPCFYWSSICLAHDMLCQQCQHWWCFAGCVPSSCTGNTIAWYWF